MKKKKVKGFLVAKNYYLLFVYYLGGKVIKIERKIAS